MRFQYHDLYDLKFEDLVVDICIDLLGIGVQPFSSGPDGGRDARFEGTAQGFPSSAAPLSGKFVIQAKHTSDPIAKFSSKGFSGTAPSSVISLETPKVKKLVKAGELDHYLLFSNRGLGADAEATLRNRLLTKTGAKSVALRPRAHRQTPEGLSRRR